MTKKELERLRTIASAAMNSGVEGEDAKHVAAFDPPTVLAMLDEIEALADELGKARPFLQAMNGVTVAELVYAAQRMRTGLFLTQAESKAIALLDRLAARLRTSTKDPEAK